MTISAVQGRIVGSDVLVSWVDTNEDSYTVTVTEYDLDNPANPTTRTVTLASPDALLWLDDDLDTATDRVTYLITNDDDAETGTVTVELTGAWTYGAPDPDASSVRYTTLAEVKRRLAIPSAQTRPGHRHHELHPHRRIVDRRLLRPQLPRHLRQPAILCGPEPRLPRRAPVGGVVLHGARYGPDRSRDPWRA